jgi:hypothetical protein
MFPPTSYFRTSWINLALVLYNLCFIGAALNHAHDLWRGGFLPYEHVPLAINAFWSTLTLVNLVAVVLLWWRRRAGLVLALVIMILDVSGGLVAPSRVHRLARVVRTAASAISRADAGRQPCVCAVSDTVKCESSRIWRGPHGRDGPHGSYRAAVGFLQRSKHDVFD